MNLPRLNVTDAALAEVLRSAVGRVYFVDDTTGAPLGYFVPTDAVDHGRYDQYPVVTVTAQQQAASGGFSQVAEVWLPDDEACQGLFVPETERDRENAARMKCELIARVDVLRPNELSGVSFDEMMWRLNPGWMANHAPQLISRDSEGNRGA
jgi:hypothetical protein